MKRELHFRAIAYGNVENGVLPLGKISAKKISSPIRIVIRQRLSNEEIAEIKTAGDAFKMHGLQVEVIEDYGQKVVIQFEEK